MFLSCFCETMTIEEALSAAVPAAFARKALRFTRNAKASAALS